MGVIMILLNTAVLNGHSSMMSVALFPKSDIRDLRSASVSEAVILSEELNGNNSILDKTDRFNISYDRFIGETNNLYHAHGALTNVRYIPYTENLTVGDDSIAIS